MTIIGVASAGIETRFPPWALMWLAALALFLAGKGAAYFTCRRAGPFPSALRRAGFWFAWPGMDAEGFLNGPARFQKTEAKEWLFAFAKMGLGILLLWVAPGSIHEFSPLGAGWAGMIGIVFLLHFGLFHLASLIWRSAGIRANPIMSNPIAATSLSEFWGRRWNTAFSELTHRFVFKPLRRRIGGPLALVMAFAASGWVHELVISWPAGSGYGGPTLYFLAQAAGLLVERSRMGVGLGLGRGWPGRMFTMLCAAAPLGWLFHPPFVHQVMLPFLEAIGALRNLS